MKKLTIITGIIATIVLITTMIKLATEIHKVSTCRNTYEYTLENGIKGTNNKCFEKNGKSICRIDNRNTMVDKIEKIEVCK